MYTVKIEASCFWCWEDLIGDPRAARKPVCASSSCNITSKSMQHRWVVRWCWVNFQHRGVLLIWITVGQGTSALVVGAGWGCLDIFSLVYHFSFLSPSLWKTARYRLKYWLKGPLTPKQSINQSIMQHHDDAQHYTYGIMTLLISIIFFSGISC